mgnify:FL=1|jgi:hypothetical protein
MSLTAEVLFVNPDYIKRITNINASVEDSYLVPSIILAQDKYIQLYLGTDLLDRLKADITAGTVSGDYATLLNSYVRKATLWWTMVDLMPSLYVKIDNGGLVIRTSEDTSTISPNDLHRETERARTNAQFYTFRLYRYLCNNSSLFPEYTSNTGADMLPQPADYYQSGMSISNGHSGLTQAQSRAILG